MIISRLEAIEKRYNELNELLVSPDVTCDIKKLTTLSKEQRNLEKIVVKFHEYTQLNKDLADLHEMAKDEDMHEMAEEELQKTNEKLEQCESDLKIMLLPKDPNDEKNIVLEVRGAVGGDEANIFAGNLFRMYSKYAETKGWKIQITDSQEGEAGGFSSISAIITGENVYSFLKYESGSHRVQRVPETEASGRIHTSTATVLVMPEAEELEVTIDPKDIRVDIFCASGPGGQGVNTTYSAVRVTHLPTGISIQCQDGRSQHENKDSCMKVLRARLYDLMQQQKADKEGAERLSKIGHGDRSEKIRTYNYPQNRVTDHRIGFTLQQLDRVMEGKLDPIIEALIAEDQKKQLSTTEE
jgi:peptide chain release factor 1